MSRAISQSEDMAGTARRLRDEINSVRNRLAAAPTAESTNAEGGNTSPQQTVKLLSHQRTFVKLALDVQALQFGSFTLKSGRVSPYFFNAARFNSGQP